MGGYGWDELFVGGWEMRILQWACWCGVVMAGRVGCQSYPGTLRFLMSMFSPGSSMHMVLLDICFLTSDIDQTLLYGVLIENLTLMNTHI